MDVRQATLANTRVTALIVFGTRGFNYFSVAHMHIQMTETEAIRSANAAENLLALVFRLPCFVVFSKRGQLRRCGCRYCCGAECRARGLEKIAAREPLARAVCS